MYHRPMDVIAAKRISRDRETSAALESQDRELREAVARRGDRLVHLVEDATVSGAVNLDERPSLGEWLRPPKVHEWQGLMVTTQDRISRDDMHWWAFVHWVLENNKTVIVLDDPSLDLSTEDGRMIAGIKATQAAKYRKAVKEKRTKQRQYYRDVDLWPGGWWPYGYRTERFEHNGRRRWRLVVDPHTSENIREAYRWLVDFGLPAEYVSKQWNARGELTPKNYQRKVNREAEREGLGTEFTETKWYSGVIRKLLASPTLMGQATFKGEVRRRDGLPVQWAEPILSLEEFTRLQDALKARSRQQDERQSRREWTGFLYCKCGRKMYARFSGGESRYFCSSRTKGAACDYVDSWPMREIERIVLDVLVPRLHKRPMVRTRYIPGQDHTARITELRTAIDNLTASLAAVSGAAAESIVNHMNNYAEELSRLEAAPIVEGETVTESLAQTYGEVWNGLDGWDERIAFLKQAGVRLVLAGHWKSVRPDIRILWPEDWADRAAV